MTNATERVLSYQVIELKWCFSNELEVQWILNVKGGQWSYQPLHVEIKLDINARFTDQMRNSRRCKSAMREAVASQCLYTALNYKCISTMCRSWRDLQYAYPDHVNMPIFRFLLTSEGVHWFFFKLFLGRRQTNLATFQSITALLQPHGVLKRCEVRRNNR